MCLRNIGYDCDSSSTRYYALSAQNQYFSTFASHKQNFSTFSLKIFAIQHIPIEDFTIQHNYSTIVSTRTAASTQHTRFCTSHLRVKNNWWENKARSVPAAASNGDSLVVVESSLSQARSTVHDAEVACEAFLRI